MQPVLPWYLRAKGKSFKGFAPGAAALFCLPFLVLGVICLWALTVRPTYDWTRAWDWEAADAVIDRAWLARSKGGDNDTYEVAVEFRYQYRGATHTGTRHSFVSSASNIGVAGMREEVERLKPGTAVTCWVNPDDPSEAVLDRSLPAQAVIGLFFATPFISVGIAGQGFLILPLLRRRLFAKRRAQMTELVAAGALPDWVMVPFADSSESEPNDVALVIAADERVPQALGMTFFNLFWNGIVGAFVCMDVVFIASGESGTGLFLSLFLVPFVAVGFLLLWMFFKCWGAMFRPGWVAGLRPVRDLEGGTTAFCWAWMDARRLAHPPEAAVRLVAQAAQWDDESNGPSRTWGKKRRPKVTDPSAARKRQLELTAVEVPIGNAAKEMEVTLPWVPFPSADAGAKFPWASKVTWGGWWQLEVTHPDGEMEVAELTQAEKLLM